MRLTIGHFDDQSEPTLAMTVEAWRVETGDAVTGLWKMWKKKSKKTTRHGTELLDSLYGRSLDSLDMP